MSIFFSGAWTGGDVADAVTLPKPAIKSEKVAPKAPAPTRDGYLQEYKELAELVGVAAPDLGIEAFKEFLRKKDWGVFDLAEVVAYMDRKAAKEAKEKAGWQWHPLREKDVLATGFGTEPERTGSKMVPASDYYRAPSTWTYSNGITYPRPGNSVYNKTIPLHALRKVAAIDQEFKTVPVHFFVCDYAPLPEIRHPDPFLMAVINNDNLQTGVGRFIIDFWDEPGFEFDSLTK